MSELVILDNIEVPAGVYVYIYKDRYHGTMEIGIGLSEGVWKSREMDLSHHAELKTRLLNMGLEMEFEGKVLDMFIKYS